MSHEQVLDHIAKAIDGALALGQHAKQINGPPTLQPARHLAIAVTALEDAASRVGNALAIDRAAQAHEEDR